MVNKSVFGFTAVTLTALMISACGGGGGGGSDSSKNQTSLQVYNVSPNSTALKIEVGEDITFSNLVYADATSTSTVDHGDYEIVVSGIDASNEYEEVLSTSGSVAKDDRNLFIVSGDYNDIQFNSINFDLDDLEDDHLRLYVGDYSTGSTGYDMYLVSSGEGFSNAEKVTTTQYGQVGLVGDFSTETYDVYITDTGTSDIVFTAERVSMTSGTSYFLMLRDTFGPGQAKFALDRVTSSTLVVSYEDNYGDAQFRMLNAYPETISTEIKNSETNIKHSNIAAGDFTSYETVPYSDYGVTVDDSNGDQLLNNVLLSLPQNSTKAVAIYRDSDGNAKGIAFNESVRELTYQSDINFINLAEDLETVDVYFVADGGTIDTTPYHFKNSDFEQVKNSMLPTNDYQITIIENRDDNTQIMVYQSPIFELDDDKNYTYALYKDASATYGYSLVVAAE
ncbi:DUF4397 domain-containing protein [Echinimonas agarilytica]|uniref:DUF4397 domain-containing protein n=1 Tax=Echinimonas agarilytica TaxID=1215918 RepID=A0AA41W5X1_9GAMM|nr:DUF4397 domain-containing protein [Echinimonas agarilytica]MCM2679512.1 DUF4397 domain-containing protein [Echinimonas agarilytica]